MTESILCPQCGSEIPTGSPAGLCPKCLVLAGLESQPPDDPKLQATQPSPPAASSGFVPPTVQELASRFPQLEIVELLGRGGMGAVYKARQKELDRLVAVKILPPEISCDLAFAERFTREARALARLSHPNIVAVYDFGRTGDGLFYFVMEYVDGVNLRQAIQSGGMSPKEALAIVPQICDALQFAHDEGIVHRDIKPENILVDKRGRVKIADFGLAKLLGQAPSDVCLTGTQQVMGTLRYMAPEQMAGTKAVDHRADIYSLGVVFYELLTGELPMGRFAPPSKRVQIDVRLDEVVLRALETDPEQRYQHVSEVKTAMEHVTSQQAGAVPPVAAPATPVPVDYVNKFIGFFMTPQPEWSRAVGIPMLIVTGIWMVVTLAVTFFVAQENQLAHEIAGITLLLVPLGLLYLTVGWMVRRTGASRVKVVAVTLCCLLVTVMLIGLLIPARWFRPDESGLPKPYEEMPAPGQPAVTYWEGHTAPVQGLAANDRWLVSAGLDGRVIVHDLMTGTGSRIAMDSSRDSAKPVDKLRCVTMAREGWYAFVGGDLGASLLKIRLDKQQENEVINVPNERGATIHTLMTCRDKNRIAYITTGDKEIVFYDIAQKRVVAKAPIPTGQAIGHVGRIAVSPYGNPNGLYIAVTSCNMVPGKNGPTSFESADPCKLTVFNDQGVECLSWQFPGQADFLNAQVVFPTNRSLAVCLPSGKMRRWMQGAGDKWQPDPAPIRIDIARYTACAASETGRVIWLAEGQRIIGIDAETGSELGSVELKVGQRRGEYVDSPIQALASPGPDRNIAAALWDGRVALASCDLRPQLIRGTVLKSFDTSDPVISTNLVMEGKGWFANCAESQTLRLFELPNPDVEDCVVTYRAQLNTKELKGRAYLEMWCRLPGEGEFFGRGLDEAVPGGKSWAEGRQTTQADFLLKPGQRPDLIRLNLVVEGTGRVGIRYVEVRTNANNSPAAPTPPPVSADQVRPALSADQIRVEDTALRLLAAMRDKEDKVLGELATDSVTKGWRNALPQFSFELREEF